MAISDWPRASEEELKPFDPEIGGYIRLAEEELIVGNDLQLQDILTNCTIKQQFAKTYRALRRDKREMLDKLRANMNNSPPDGQLFQVLMMRNYDRVMTYKLRQMEDHFLAKWGEDIEVWAGKEGDALDRSGCLVFVAAGASLATMASAGLLILIAT